jgi:hypothetical protein
MTGIDYDLSACLDYNPQDTFSIESIQRVHAVWEGDNDGPAWRWVLELKDGRFAYLQGGCDYTGWDCRSYAFHHIVESAEQAAQQDEEQSVIDDLLRQIEQGKDLTWRQQMDVKMGINSLDPSSYVNPDLDGAI